MWWLVSCVNTHHHHIKWNPLDKNNHTIMRIGNIDIIVLNSCESCNNNNNGLKTTCIFSYISSVWKVIPSNKTLMHFKTCVGRASFTWRKKHLRQYSWQHDNPFFKLVDNMSDKLSMCSNEKCMYVCMYVCMHVYMYVCVYVCALCMCNHNKTSDH